MRVSIEDSHTRQGKDLVVYLDDGGRIYSAPVRSCAALEQYHLETMLEAVREEAKAEESDELEWAVMGT